MRVRITQQLKLKIQQLELIYRQAQKDIDARRLVLIQLAKNKDLAAYRAQLAKLALVMENSGANVAGLKTKLQLAI